MIESPCTPSDPLLFKSTALPPGGTVGEGFTVNLALQWFVMTTVLQMVLEQPFAVVVLRHTV